MVSWLEERDGEVGDPISLIILRREDGGLYGISTYPIRGKRFALLMYGVLRISYVC